VVNVQGETSPEFKTYETAILFGAGVKMKFSKLLAGIALTVLLTGFGAAPSNAVVLQTSNSGGVGNQAWSGVGLEFTVNAPINVTAIGIFDSGLDGIFGSLTADLMTLGGTVLASSVFTSTAGPLTNGGYLFQAITPVTLAVGTYYLMGYGWTGTDLEHNSNVFGLPDTFTGSGLVSYVQSAWTGSGGDPAGTVPNNFGGPNYFSSANIVLSAVPEPSTWAMMLLGFVGLGWLYRRKARRSPVLSAA
jgi:hypothetical protein